MVKFLLLALAFGLANAHPHAEMAGKWETTAIAADNVDKIDEGKELRVYVRKISCNVDCSEMDVTFYVNSGYHKEIGLCPPIHECVLNNHCVWRPVTELYALLLEQETLRIYHFREVKRANGQCSKTRITGYRQEDDSYKTQFEGDNTFEPVDVTPKSIFFTSRNVDRSGLETKLIFVIGKGEPLTSEEHEKLEALAEEQGIPVENIQDVLATDTCPK